MERFIRQKYERKSYMAGAPPPSVAPPPAAPMYTGDTASSDEHPPPPPPKPARRFGFGLRSSSSAFPLGRSFRGSQSQEKGASITPLQVDKPSRFIGASIGVTESDQGLEWKLLQLKEMGFSDDRKNTDVLRGLDGNLERAIESLVRLGEGSGPSTNKTPISSQIPSRQHTPNPPFSAGARVVSVQSTPSQSSQLSPPASARSNNPFDVPNPVSLPQQSLENAFSNMDITSQQPQQTQPLFPNATGPQHIVQMQLIQGTQQQPMMSPTQQMPQAGYNNPYAQQQSPNPFITPQQQNLSSPAQTNPFFSQQQATPSSNPFLNQQYQGSALFSPSQGQFAPQQQVQPQTPQSWIQPQQQQQPQTPQIWTQPQPPQQSVQPMQQQQFLQSPTQLTNPQSFTTPQPAIYAQPSPYGPMSPLNLHSPYQQQFQPLSAQSTGRIDKSSILALYNYPQLAPASATPTSQVTNQSSAGQSPQGQPAQLAQFPPGVMGGPQRSVTMPVSTLGNRNPFLSAGGPQQSSTTIQPSAPWHASRESSDNGRHSPDAFASLSARFVR